MMKTYKEIAGDGGSNIIGQVAAQQQRLSRRLGAIKHIILILSGKGGVGKSSLTVNFAAALAQRNHSVGILDADINGPSVAEMTNVKGQILAQNKNGVTPALTESNIKVMSIDLLMGDDTAPLMWDSPVQKNSYSWRGLIETSAIKELLSDTKWGSLDYLLIDMAPGADKLPNIVDLIPQISGAIIVTIPSRISQFVVGKSIRLAKDLLNNATIWLVENMSSYICRHCGEEEILFPSNQVEMMADRNEIEFLGKVPFDPRIAVSCDDGIPHMVSYGDSHSAKAIREISQKIKTILENKTKNLEVGP
jgi:ATP-binding protein involved in chromosome partitioning